METFDADWLALREPLDHISRSKDLIAPLVHAWDTGGWSRVLDLGSGTGSNLRYLAPRLPPDQDWVLVDHDPDHLRTLRALKRPPGVRSLTVSSRDLATHEWGDMAGADLVTASALLDLTSNGRISWSEGRLDDPSVGPGTGGTVQDDLLVREAVNAHQAGDKGFGPALGPAAAALAEERFRLAGYRTTLHESAWRLGGEDRPIVERLIEGWAGAAAAMRPNDEARIRVWAEAKRTVVETGAFSLTVGHHDLLALPPERP